MNKLICQVLTFVVLFSCPLVAQEINPDIVKSIALIEQKVDSGYKSHGTGFLYYNYNYEFADPEIIVVTCKHVVKNHDSLVIRINPSKELQEFLDSDKEKAISFSGVSFSDGYVRINTAISKDKSFFHPTLDIAAFYVRAPLLFAVSDTTARPLKAADFKQIPKSSFKLKEQVKLGEEVVFLGFPLGIGGIDFVEPVLRTGAVAWMPRKYNMFLLDAFSYGGNSGSPVFQRSSGKLIGMVFGHHSIELKNVLNQPNPNELKFEVNNMALNIGLASCVYSDDILYTLERLINK